MTITEAADTLSVSAASVRNWIRTGYLQFDREEGISRQSFEDFCTHVAGSEKLVKRVNKSLLDEHDHAQLVATTRAALRTATDLAEVGEEYQAALSNAWRNREGVYYTPESVCDAMFSDVLEAGRGHSFCDPCCGSGNFIMSAIRHGFEPEHIHGYDTDPVAVEITRRRIFEETGYVTDRIVCADFLDLVTRLDGKSPSFDVILSNPPWGKKLAKAEKNRYGRLLDAGRSLDTSALFFFASLRVLKDGGALALLLPESFFKIAVFEDARKELLRHSLRSVRDFGRPFKGLLTRAQSFSMIKADDGLSRVACINGDISFERARATFSANPGHIINFASSPGDAAVLARLFSKPYLTLKGNAGWGLGIVTGNNNRFCRDQCSAGLIPVYTGADIHKGFRDEPTTFIPGDFSLYQQVAPVGLFAAKEKILYRFISSDLVFCHDRDQSYCLNSVNMIVLADDFPVSTAAVVKLFNTGLFNWAFGKMFNTHKILKTDLQSMPVPVEFLSANENFLEEELLEYYNVARDRDGAFTAKG